MYNHVNVSFKYSIHALLLLLINETLKVLSDDEVALLSHALVQSNYQEKLKLLLDLEEMAHDRELMER